MKSLPLDLTVETLFPARLLTITRRDGTVIRVAEAQRSITVGAETWTPNAGLMLSGIRHTMGGEPADMSITVSLHDTTGEFLTGDVVNGKFDSASVQVDVVDRTNPTTLGRMFTGFIGPLQFSSNRLCVFEARGASAPARGNFMQTFGPMCRTDLGSSLCKIPLRPADLLRSTAYMLGDFRRVRFDANGTPDDYRNRIMECTTAGVTDAAEPAFSDTIGATTVDGSVVWTTRESWSRHAKISFIENEFVLYLDRNPDEDRGVTNWFNQGSFRMFDGPSANRAFEVAAWEPGLFKVTTYLPLGAAFGLNLIEIGDWLEIWPGCDLTIGTCADKFANAFNFRAEPYFLGADALAATQG